MDNTPDITALPDIQMTSQVCLMHLNNWLPDLHRLVVINTDNARITNLREERVEVMKN